MTSMTSTDEAKQQDLGVRRYTNCSMEGQTASMGEPIEIFIVTEQI